MKQSLTTTETKLSKLHDEYMNLEAKFQFVDNNNQIASEKQDKIKKVIKLLHE